LTTPRHWGKNDERTNGQNTRKYSTTNIIHFTTLQNHLSNESPQNTQNKFLRKEEKTQKEVNCKCETVCSSPFEKKKELYAKRSKEEMNILRIQSN